MAGTVKSWNFDDSNNIHGNNQAYSICIRREKGFCGYSVIPASEPDRFKDKDDIKYDVFENIFPVFSGIYRRGAEQVRAADLMLS